MKKNEMENKKKRAKSTQAHLPIVEIKEDAVILRGGALRAVLMVSSINFDLKSEDEQVGTIGSYVSFLNSLQHPIQIVVQSRRLDIEGYLEQVRARRKEQLNELLKLQTAEYEQYIAELVDLASIMTKRYYVVIPYDPIADISQSFFARLQHVLWTSSAIGMRRKEFDMRKGKLEKRVVQVHTGLRNIGLQARRLDTQSLIELYYDTFNPSVAQNQRLPVMEKIEVQ